MKIGIITQHNYTNYGNRLQNLATDVILKDLGHDPISLVVSPSNFLIAFNQISKPFFCFPLRRRMRNFIKFTKKYLKTYSMDSKCLKRLTKKFGTNGTDPLDCALVGSDQTWNPKYVVNSNQVFARFVDKEKRMTFSTSFGVSKIPQKNIADYTKGLSEIKNISVRETAGAKIVKDLTGKECPVLLDPTLILSKEKWIELANESPVEIPKEKYIFCYFLAYNRKYRNWIKTFAKKHSLKIVNINKYTGKYFSSDPLGFVKLLMNAEIVCTNSFHGHAFSVCLEKPFVSFPVTKSTNSRTQTLLNLTGIKNRHYAEVENGNVFNIDYTNITPIIEKEREKAISYLTKSLNEIEKAN